MKNNKGITLIALVVTIIVLIILAGISISLLFGENGIIGKAKDAGEKYKEGAKEEEQTLASVEQLIDSYLNGSGGGSSGGNNNTPTVSKNTGPLSTAVNASDYGKRVYNYTAKNLIWELFYEDANNYYLISRTQDNEYPLSNVCGCNYENGVYSPVDPYYVSGESVSQQGKDLMQLACGQTSTAYGTNPDGINLFTSLNTNPNIWLTAYLCDTRDNGPWSEFVEYPAAWAMGGPTLELLTASYNAKFNTNYMSYSINNIGYTTNCSGLNCHCFSEPNTIYRLKYRGGNKTWYASPGGAYPDNVEFGGLSSYEQEGKIWDGTPIYYGLNARPIVCISKSTGFVCQFTN